MRSDMLLRGLREELLVPVFDMLREKLTQRGRDKDAAMLLRPRVPRRQTKEKEKLLILQDDQ